MQYQHCNVMVVAVKVSGVGGFEGSGGVQASSSSVAA